MSFRLKTILGVALIELLLLCALIFSSITTLRSTNQQAIRDEATSVVQMFATLAANAIITDDLATLDHFAQALTKQDRVAYVRILDNDGFLLAQGGKNPELRSEGQRNDIASTDDDGFLHVAATVFEEEFAFGRIELGFSTEFINVLVADATKKLGTLALVELALSGVFSFMLGTYLTRSLDSLRNTAEKISQGAVGLRIKMKGNDEVAQTASALDNMSRRLKETYDALKYREKRNRVLLSNIVEAVVTLDENANIQEFNIAAERLFGCSADEAKGKSIAIFLEGFIDKYGNHAGECLAKLAGRIDKTCSDFDGLRADGTSFPLEICVNRVQLESELCFSCVIRDLTEHRREQQDALLAKKVFESSGEAIIVTDTKRNVVAANPAFSVVTGYAPGEFIGRPSVDLHCHEMQPTASTHFRQAIEEHGVWTGEVWHRGKYDRSYPVRLTATKITNKEGEVTNYVMVMRDITEQKHAERMKSEFVSTVSHELRTPLTVIKGSLELVASGKFGELPAPCESLIEKAVSNSQRLGRLIDDILDMEKIEAGNMEFVQEPIAISDLLLEAASAYGAYAADRGVTCQVLDSQFIATVFADKSRLMQVMANFMSNAAKYAPDDTAIALSAMRCDEGIKIAVRDHGPGIPEDAQSKIFDKFVQADASDSRAQGGTGLGLNIAKAIVEQHEGRIDFQTGPEFGTEFFFIIPEFTGEKNIGQASDAETLAS